MKGSAGRALALAGALAVLALAGCADRTAETGSLVLTMVLRNTGDGERHGGLGPHCATAQVLGDRVRIEQDSTAAERRGPVLVVDSSHDWETGWLAVGTDPFAIPLASPAAVAPHVDGANVTVATVAWDGEGDARVDGAAVQVPHDWTFRAPDGSWEADLSLAMGPRLVEWHPRSQALCG